MAKPNYTFEKRQKELAKKKKKEEKRLKKQNQDSSGPITEQPPSIGDENASNDSET
jgi:hypothetical protein